MKRIVMMTLFLPSMLMNSTELNDILPIYETECIDTVEQIQPLLEKDLINALIYVESRGNDSAVGDIHLGEPSVGVLQIRPVMVREVNRILKKMGSTQRYKLKDRFDRQSSIEMFLFWKNYHHPEGGFEEIARCWNGGPRGLKNKRTEKYWAKVQNQLDI